MTEREKLEEISRKKKLEQARREVKSPRGNAVQSKSNSEKREGKRGKWFQVRLLFASILFLSFLVSKQEKLSYKDWDCDKIMEMVQYDVGIDSVEVYRIAEKDYKIDFRPMGTFDDFEEKHKI